MAKHNELGKYGEERAADFLAAKGYAIAHRNWRSGHYELDIVAYHNSRIVFVEVKTRSSNDVDPLEAVDSKKSMRLIRAALAYVEQNNIKHPLQFDLIAITDPKTEGETIEHIEDAFVPPMKTY